MNSQKNYLDKEKNSEKKKSSNDMESKNQFNP